LGRQVAEGRKPLLAGYGALQLVYATKVCRLIGQNDAHPDCPAITTRVGLSHQLAISAAVIAASPSRRMR
jgi:hypothetical protein